MRFKTRSCIYLAALLVLAAGSAGATTARLRALGGGAAYLEDPANVLSWYGSLGDYPDQALIETGTWKLNGGYPGEAESRISGGWAGAHLAVPGGVTLAAFYHDRFDDGDPAQLIPSQLGHGMTLLACRAFGPAQVGLALRYGSFSDSWRDSTTGGLIIPSYVPEAMGRDLRRLDLGLGVRLDLNEGAYLDFAGERRGVRIEESRIAALEDDYEGMRESNGTFAGRIRAFFRSSENSALAPHVELQRVDQPLPLVWYGLMPEVDVWQLRAGTGWSWFPDPDRMILLYYEYLYGEGDMTTRSLSPSFAEARYDLKWNAGRAGIALETRFLPWLSLRTAYRWEYRSRSETVYSPIGTWSGRNPVETDGIEHFLSLGAGLHLGRTDVDLTVGEGYPYAPGSNLGTTYFEPARNWLTMSVRRPF